MHMRVCVLCLRAATELDVTFDSSSRNGKARIPKGWKSFLRRSELLKVDSGFLVDGRLKISANVTVKTETRPLATKKVMAVDGNLILANKGVHIIIVNNSRNARHIRGNLHVRN